MKNNLTIEVIKIRKITIRDIEVESSFVTDIEIFESLIQPGLTGFIKIRDYQGLQEIGNIFAGDDISISFYVDNDEANEITLKLKIYSNNGSTHLPLNTYEFLQFSLCSPWLFDGLGRTMSKPYKEKYIHEIITDLLKECGAEIGFVEPTKHKIENFISPLWTPYHTIKYLLSFAINNEGQGGYLCWTDFKTGKVNVSSLDYLLKGSLGNYKTFVVNTNNIRYTGRVMNMTIESNYDTIRMLNNGIPNTKFYGFNFDKKQIVTSKNDITKTKQTRLGTKFPLPNSFNNKKYTKHIFTPLFPQSASPLTSDDKMNELVEGIEKNNYAFLSTDTFKINIETLGEMKRRVGWIAEFDYPSAGANAGESGSKAGQKQYKGNYLIRDIKHKFSLYDDYKQYITLVSDGFKEFNGDLITWDSNDVRI